MNASTPLHGWKPSAARAADRLQIWKLYYWFRQSILGEIAVISPFIDPFGAGILLVAMSERIASDPRDEIEIPVADLPRWLDEKTRGHPDYRPRIVGNELRHQLGSKGAQVISSEHGVSFFASFVGEVLRINVVERRRCGPKFSRGQAHHLWKLLHKEEHITQEVIEKYRQEALSRDWPSPFPNLPDDQPVEIIIEQAPLRARIFGLLARIW